MKKNKNESELDYTRNDTNERAVSGRRASTHEELSSLGLPESCVVFHYVPRVDINPFFKQELRDRNVASRCRLMKGTAPKQ